MKRKRSNLDIDNIYSSSNLSSEFQNKNFIETRLHTYDKKMYFVQNT